MFDIDLFIVSDENHRVNKKLNEKQTITGSLRNETDVVHPVILIEGLFWKYNYCYIAAWDRYYYIRDKRSIRNNLVELNLEVDVLMSHREQLLKVNAIIDKQESISNANMYIDDGDWIVQNNEFINIINFSNGFNNEGEFILIAAGGGGVSP